MAGAAEDAMSNQEDAQRLQWLTEEFGHEFGRQIFETIQTEYGKRLPDIKPKYKGPYPRVQSRKGIQKEQPVGNSWKKIIDKENEIFNIIQNLYNDKKG